MHVNFRVAFGIPRRKLARFPLLVAARSLRSGQKTGFWRQTRIRIPNISPHLQVRERRGVERERGMTSLCDWRRSPSQASPISVPDAHLDTAAGITPQAKHHDTPSLEPGRRLESKVRNVRLMRGPLAYMHNARQLQDHPPIQLGTNLSEGKPASFGVAMKKL